MSENAWIEWLEGAGACEDARMFINDCCSMRHAVVACGRIAWLEWLIEFDPNLLKKYLKARANMEKGYTWAAGVKLARRYALMAMKSIERRMFP